MTLSFHCPARCFHCVGICTSEKLPIRNLKAALPCLRTSGVAVRTPETLAIPDPPCSWAPPPPPRSWGSPLEREHSFAPPPGSWEAFLAGNADPSAETACCVLVLLPDGPAARGWASEVAFQPGFSEMSPLCLLKSGQEGGTMKPTHQVAKGDSKLSFFAGGVTL